MTAPLVVTARLDGPAQEILDELRRRHFPPARNVLAAHLTLFHAVPGSMVDEVGEALAEVSRRPPLPLRVEGTRLLGRGLAVRFGSAELLAVRAELAARWWPALTAQDRGKKDLHVTVQNKVDPAVARALAAQLDVAGLPAAATATGLALWRYEGGPWAPVAVHPFVAHPLDTAPELGG